MNNITTYEANIFRPMLREIYGIVENNEKIGSSL